MNGSCVENVAMIAAHNFEIAAFFISAYNFDMCQPATLSLVVAI